MYILIGKSRKSKMIEQKFKENSDTKSLFVSHNNEVSEFISGLFVERHDCPLDRLIEYIKFLHAKERISNVYLDGNYSLRDIRELMKLEKLNSELVLTVTMNSDSIDVRELVTNEENLIRDLFSSLFTSPHNELHIVECNNCLFRLLETVETHSIPTEYTRTPKDLLYEFLNERRT